LWFLRIISRFSLCHQLSESKNDKEMVFTYKNVFFFEIDDLISMK